MFLAILNDVVSMDIIWLGVAALAYILKMITKHYVFACIAVAALICAFCVFAEIEMRPLWELVIFVVATIALSFFIQPYVLRKKLEETEVVRKIPDFPQKNKEAIVVERIDNTIPTGRVMVDGEEFVARSATGGAMEVGEHLSVVDCDGHILIVI